MEPPLTTPFQASILPDEPVSIWHQSRKQPVFPGHLWMLVSGALFLGGQPERSKCTEGHRLYGTWPSQACRQQGTLGSRGGKNSQQMDSNLVSLL